MVELVDTPYIWGTADVLTYGANKYTSNNWRKGIPESEIVGALMRHMLKFRQGELVDPETGLDHRYHMSCNNMFWTGLYPLKTVDDKITKVQNFWNGLVN